MIILNSSLMVKLQFGDDLGTVWGQDNDNLGTVVGSLVMVWGSLVMVWGQIGDGSGADC